MGCSIGFIDENQVPEAVSEDQWEIVNTTAFTHVQITCSQWVCSGYEPLGIPTRPTTQVEDNVGIFGGLLYN